MSSLYGVRCAHAVYVCCGIVDQRLLHHQVVKRIALRLKSLSPTNQCMASRRSLMSDPSGQHVCATVAISWFPAWCFPLPYHMIGTMGQMSLRAEDFAARHVE